MFQYQLLIWWLKIAFTCDMFMEIVNGNYENDIRIDTDKIFKYITVIPTV